MAPAPWIRYCMTSKLSTISVILRQPEHQQKMLRVKITNHNWRGTFTGKFINIFYYWEGKARVYIFYNRDVPNWKLLPIGSLHK